MRYIVLLAARANRSDTLLFLLCVTENSPSSQVARVAQARAPRTPPACFQSRTLSVSLPFAVCVGSGPVESDWTALDAVEGESF